MPEQVRADLAEYMEVCSALAPEHRWVRPASLHLTLHFLGAQPPSQVTALSAGLRRIHFQPYEVALGSLGTFGGRRARVIWLAVAEGADFLRGLSTQVQSACAEVGIAADRRAYNPHLTLARSRDRAGSTLPQLPSSPRLPAWTVNRFALYQSRLARGGAEYSLLETFDA